MVPKILLVDDDPDIIKMLSRAFRKKGWDVRSASSGQEALKIIEEKWPNLIVLDIVLSGDVNSYKVLWRIRASKNGISKIPIILITGHCEKTDLVNDCQVLGSEGFFHKPFSPLKMIKRIEILLNQRQHGSRHNGSIGNMVSDERLIEIGEVKLCPSRRCLNVGKRMICLTKKEFLLARAIMRKRGRIATREQLLAAAWSKQEVAQINGNGVHLVEVHMSGLRRKLGPQKDFFCTLNGAGYRVCTERKNGH